LLYAPALPFELSAAQRQFLSPACLSDSVSRAARPGQFAFEQTFYLPVSAMKDPERSPLRVLERLAGRKLA